VRTLQPSLVFAGRIDRMARRAWDLGPLALSQEGRWIGDERQIRPANMIESLIPFYTRMVETTSVEERRRMQQRARLSRQLRREA
jgi:hypothetical protein